MRFFVTISYDGSGFSGWQIQPNAPSVQEEVHKAFSTILGEQISVTGAGRTDTGVNAIGFVAHFDSNNGTVLKEHGKTIYKLNAILPEGIAVHSIVPVRNDAHARFDAVSRTYKYYVHTSKDPFSRSHSWHCRFGLDIVRMNEAASLLLGRHDFRCFEKMHGNSSSSVCTVTRAEWTLNPDSVLPGEHLVFTVSANRFLRNMVRAIVGTLIEIGRGKRPPEWILEVMASGDRCKAGQSVPGNALFFTGIEYPESVFHTETEIL